MTDRETKIRQRAYELWHAAGMPDDKAEEHWAEAEREVGEHADTDQDPEDGQAKLGTINDQDD